MRSVRSWMWVPLFVLGAALPAFCQPIFPPNGSGFRIPADAGTLAYQQTVFSTGAFDAALAVFQNSQLKFFATGIVCTAGPLTDVSINVPFGSFGLNAGDLVIFVFRVHHRATEGGTCSTIVSVIPVGPPDTSSSPPSPPSQSRLVRPGEEELARWARQEEHPIG